MGRGLTLDGRPELLRKSSRASSRASDFGCDSDSFGPSGQKSISFADDSDDDDEDNPPFDLPPWLILRLHGEDGHREDDDDSSSGGLSDSSGGFSDVSA